MQSDEPHSAQCVSPLFSHHDWAFCSFAPHQGQHTKPTFFQLFINWNSLNFIYFGHIINNKPKVLSKTNMSTEVTEDERLISEAASYYRCRDFKQCSLIMEKLKIGRLNDTKINMNNSLLNYVHKSSYSASEQYIRELKQIATVEGVNLDDYDDKTCALGRRSSDRLDEVCNSKDVLSNNNNIAPQFVSRSSIAINLLYNYAVVLFYQRHYTQVERLLATCLDISTNSESADNNNNKVTVPKGVPLTSQSPSCIDQPTASLIQTMDLTPSTDIDLCRRIILLWLEVSLRLFQAERVFELCDYWILCLNSLSVACGSANTPVNTYSSLEQANPNSHHLNNNNNNDNNNNTILSVLAGIKKPIQLYYIKACLLTGRLNDAENELNSFMSEDDSLLKSEENSSKNDCTPLPSDDNAGDRKSEKSSQSNSQDNNNSNNNHCSTVQWSTGNAVYFLQAQLAYLKGCYSDAVKLLSSIPPPSYNSPVMNDWESIILKNNLALLYHRTGRFTSSVIHLRNALKQVDKTLDTATQSVNNDLRCMLNHQNGCFSIGEYSELLNQIPLHVSSVIEHYELVYNYGIQLLFTQRPLDAFSTLSQLVRIYPRNPRLWFRLAECCIKLHCPHNLSLWKVESRKRCVVESVGCGSFRKLMLASVNPETVNPKVDEALLSSPSLEFASLALRNALLLLPTPPVKLITNVSSNKDTITSSYTDLVKWSNKQFVPTYPSPTPLWGIGLLHFLSALHVNICYVALCLNQPIEVIHSASQMLNFIPQNENNPIGSVKCGTYGTNFGAIAPKAHSYLCRLYYAEALTYLDRIDEATSLLHISSDNEYDSIARCLNGVCFETPFLFPSIDESVNNDTDVCNQFSQSMLVNSHSKQSVTRPIDFPANPVQSSALLAYNLAVLLAIQKQYRLSKQYLDMSLSGLLISANQLDGRKWYTDLAEELSALNNYKLLPTSVLLLCIYLEIGLGHRKQAAELIREHFGHTALAGRLNPPVGLSTRNNNSDGDDADAGAAHEGGTSDTDPSSIIGKSIPTTLIELQQLIKGQQQHHLHPHRQQQQQQQQHKNVTSSSSSNTISQTRQPPPLAPPMSQFQQMNNRSNNLWTPCSQFRQSQAQQNQPVYYSPLLQTQPALLPPQQTQSTTLANYEYAASRWDHPPPPAPPSTTTGLITANNENDWPPL
ncbi:unnamed protein product [Trichobilharzia szidati]|nr:unnamed protein product [Trichobilharzia szidati]CAH8846685.1 unnamed protein product [Trichobilharzia szidati]